MEGARFDQYRSEYPTMTDEDMARWHSEAYADYPDQASFSVDAVRDFFGRVTAESVLEVGGWKGELASLMLGENKTVRRWENHEVTREAALATVCTDPRYSAIPSPLWKFPRGFDTAVLSHVIEHYSDEQAVELFSDLADIKQVYIDAPITNPRQSGWLGDDSYHVMLMTHADLNAVLMSSGFTSSGELGKNVWWYGR